MAEKKLTKKQLRRLRRKLKKEQMEKKQRMEEEGFDLFFRNDNYMMAHPEEAEGHYPGNQRNTVILVDKRKVVHTSSG